MRSIISFDLPIVSKMMGLQNIVLLSFLVQGLALKPEDSGIFEWTQENTHTSRNTWDLYEKHPCILYDAGTVEREIRERIYQMTDDITLSNQHIITKTTMTLLRNYCLFVSTFAKKKNEIDMTCPVNDSDIYNSTFETYDMCPLWDISYHNHNGPTVRKRKTPIRVKLSLSQPTSGANFNTNVEAERGPNSEFANNTNTEQRPLLESKSETGNNTHIETHKEEVEVHINSKNGTGFKHNRIFRSTVRTVFRVVVASAVEYDTLPERRYNELNNNETSMHGNLLNNAYSILTAMKNFLDTVNAYSAFVFSYIWIPVEIVCSFFESVLDSVEEYVDYFLRIVLDYPVECLATVLGYLFQGLVIACQYIFWAIGSVFNATICAFIQTMGEYILEWPLSMLGLGLQNCVTFLGNVLIFIVTDVLLFLLFVVLKFLTALIFYYLPNIIYFVLHGTVYLTVHFLKLVVIYPLVFIMFWVFENVYVMTLGMVLITLVLYVGIFILTFACLRFTYVKFQRMRSSRHRHRRRPVVDRRTMLDRTVLDISSRSRRVADRTVVDSSNGTMRGNLLNDSNKSISEATYELNQQFDDNQECIICFESKTFVQLIPCHHSSMCQDCILKLMGTTRTCPLCREMIWEYKCNFDTF